MSQAIIPIAIAILSGLSFITYNHPVKARNILYLVFAVIITSFIISTALTKARMNSYHDTQTTVDSVLNNSNKYFSAIINLRNKEFSEDILNAGIDRSLKLANMDISKSIDKLIDNDNSMYHSVAIYLLIGFISNIILYGLSFTFEKIHKENREDANH